MEGLDAALSMLRRRVIVVIYATALTTACFRDTCNAENDSGTTAQQQQVQVAGGFSFVAGKIPPSVELIKQGNNTSTDVDNNIWLTPDPNKQKQDQMGGNTGRLVCETPLASLDGIASPTDVVSLQSIFDFQFITPPVSSGTGGDGMAFFISPRFGLDNNTAGGGLGIANPDTANVTDPSLHLFAVEFDTYRNSRFRDPNNNHVGIDFDSLVSNVTVDTNSTALDLYSNSTFRVWLDYLSANNSVEVRMLNLNASSADRPADPLLQITYDLSALILLSGSDMFVGLSATTGANFQGCAISSWNFTLAVLQPSAPPPAIAPAPNASSSTNPPETDVLLRKLVPGVVAAIVAAAAAVAVAIVAYRKRWCCSLDRGGAFAGHGDGDGDADGIAELGVAELALIPHDALVPAAMPRYTFNQLSKATQGFHDKAKVGYGGYSTVYKGRLIIPVAPTNSARDCGRPTYAEVAVKRLNKEGLRKREEFFAEIKTINRLQHPRLVELKGWCYERGEAMLVYEFMGGGSVADQLFARGKKKGAANDALLSSEVRVGILKGVAEALAHVHAAGAVHRDVKAANVLLSDDMDAKLGDFGLLRLLKDDKQMTQTMTAAGTPGYTAPELLFTRTPTDKVDVYSYGVLMLEVACGRRAIDAGLLEHHNSQVLLLDWVWSKHERGDLMSVLDPKMFNGGRIEDEAEEEEEEGEGARGIWRCVLHLALRCCHPIPEERPSMKDVLDSLERNALVPLEKSRPMYRVAHVPQPSELVAGLDYGSMSSGYVSSGVYTSSSSYASSAKLSNDAA